MWALQDTLALSPEKAIELKREYAAGQGRVIWNPALSLPARQFEFSEAEVVRIKTAIETWSAYGVNPTTVG